MVETRQQKIKREAEEQHKHIVAQNEELVAMNYVTVMNETTKEFTKLTLPFTMTDYLKALGK